MGAVLFVIYTISSRNLLGIAMNIQISHFVAIMDE